MSKLKKMLLMISSTLVVSCSAKAPKLDGPMNRAVPTFAKDAHGVTQVMSWRWDEWFTGNKWTTSNETARKVVPVCLDLASYNKGEVYAKNLKKYVEYLESELEKCRARKN